MKAIIKFRGQEIDSNKWLYGDLFQRLGCYPEIIFPYIDENGKTQYAEIAVKEKTVGQFTGLSDKNKKDIYKGDIIRTPLGNIVIVEFGYKEHVVKNHKLRIFEKYACYGWLARNIKTNQVEFLDDTIIKGEIIGNIHDNPELLNEAQNFSPTCATCNSYDNGKCTNFGKEVKSEDSCKYYQSDVIEYTCQQCGRKYEIIDSDAGDREKFCCKACENGY
jgi:uncharacterized phage protein (TIGR01671 family)